MNQDRDARLKQGGRPGRALGIHMSRTEARAPARHREERDVEWSELRHLGEEVGVAGEVDGGPPPDYEAEGLRVGAAERQALGRVDGAHRLDRDTAYLGAPPPLELLDLEAGPPNERPGPGGRDYPRSAAEQAERGQVEVIVMQMRDEDRVNAARHLGRRAVAAQVGDPGAQHRIGQEAHTAVLEEHGGVAEIADSRESSLELRGTGVSAPAGRHRITRLG